MTLFVSKSVKHKGLLKLVDTLSAQLIDRSMISFERVIFESVNHDQYDVIFFSSPRSVDYFLEQSGTPENKKIACIGQSTASRLKYHGLTVDYEGEKSGHPKEVAQSFAAFAKGLRVLFPQSDRSHRSMQSALDPDQIIDLVVYRTILKPIKLNVSPDVLVFTSPSNVESFLIKNKCKEKQLIIAWGKTTADMLIQHGIHYNHILSYSSFDELVDYLSTKLTSLKG